MKMPTWVRSLSGMRAMPKSASFQRLSPACSTLAGFTSRWTMRWRCANDSALARSSPICTQRASGRRTRSRRSASDSPGRYSSTMNGAPDVLVDADVEDRDDRRMRHLRGGLRLALEPLEERRAHAPALLLRRHDRLHRDDAIEQRIARLVDDAHRALADGLDDLVATDRLAALLARRRPAPAALRPCSRVFVRGRAWTSSAIDPNESNTPGSVP